MDAQVRKSRLSPSFDINEILIIDHLRGTRSRAAFLRQRIGVLAQQSPRARDRLAQVSLPSLPDTGSARVDIRLAADLLRAFETWLDGQLRPGDALRALVRIEGEAHARGNGRVDAGREPVGRAGGPQVSREAQKPQELHHKLPSVRPERPVRSDFSLQSEVQIPV